MKTIGWENQADSPSARPPKSSVLTKPRERVKASGKGQWLLQEDWTIMSEDMQKTALGKRGNLTHQETLSQLLHASIQRWKAMRARVRHSNHEYKAGKMHLAPLTVV